VGPGSGQWGLQGTGNCYLSRTVISYDKALNVETARRLLPAVLERDEHGPERTRVRVKAPDAIGDIVDSIG